MTSSSKNPQWYRPWDAYRDPKEYGETYWKKNPAMYPVVKGAWRQLKPKTSKATAPPKPSPRPDPEVTMMRASAEAKKKARRRQTGRGRLSTILAGEMMSKHGKRLLGE